MMTINLRYVGIVQETTTFTRVGTYIVFLRIIGFVTGVTVFITGKKPGILVMTS